MLFTHKSSVSVLCSEEIRRYTKLSKHPRFFVVGPDIFGRGLALISAEDGASLLLYEEAKGVGAEKANHKKEAPPHFHSLPK